MSNRLGLFLASTMVFSVVNADDVKFASPDIVRVGFEHRYADKELSLENCEVDNTAIVTVYSSNRDAQQEIEVDIDGSHVGVLTTYFPDGSPICKTPSTAGIITRRVSAGDHRLEAESLNLTWPEHSFSVEKCGCMAIELP